MYKMILVTKDADGEFAGYTIKTRSWRLIEKVLDDVEVNEDDYGEYYQERVEQGTLIKSKVDIIDHRGNHYKGEAPNFADQNVMAYIVYDETGDMVDSGWRGIETLIFMEKHYDGVSVSDNVAW